MKRTFSLLFGVLLGLPGLYAQKAQAPLTPQAFWGPRLINGQTTEVLPAGKLNFAVAHRFGPLDGVQNFFGMDGTSNFRLGLAYGLTDRLTTGLGRSRLEKRYDAFVKYKVLRQRDRGMPLSATVLVGSSINTEPLRPGQESYFRFDHRLHYQAQVLLSRKLGFRWSVQLAPTVVHRNLVDYASEGNTSYALGSGLRVQLTPRMALTGEYYLRLQPGQHPFQTYQNPLGLSLDIETVYHRFQLQFTNAFSLLESEFIPDTVGDHSIWPIRFGFNISRVFF